ncbi:Biotin synthase [Actinidia chinensis var. chinensis]|uniref:Biotin synthase n=1 Tax=Actinidia chinensis var. chinensis TaxID=1590841 RepID=A0A2R6RY82_ACTCC|nr:Biotin synthase [Actinidia chinensis var. chinensis]
MVPRWRKMTTYDFDQLRLYFDTTKAFSSLSARRLMCKYFSLRSALVMVVLTVSLLVLPLVLPPLPPPPVELFLVPILIMAVLILLACSPSNIPNVAVTSI